MILLKQNYETYNTDLRTMIQAFFPGIKIVEELNEEPLFTLSAVYDESRTYVSIDSFSEELGNSVIRDDSFFSEDKTLDFFGNIVPVKESGASFVSKLVIFDNYLDKENFRNEMKYATYKLLCTFTGRTLPWGDMTGVRPTKIALGMLADKNAVDCGDVCVDKNAVDCGDGCVDAVVRHYQDMYGVSERKAKLATMVAKNELCLVKDIELDNSYSLYVGIPFCPSRCLYCSFTAYPIASYKNLSVDYVDYLCKEISEVAKQNKDKKLTSIYVGGGTPTAISHELLDKLLAHINDTFEINDGKILEFTVEAGRPDSITMEKLVVMKNRGVSRISINPQTMNDETLKTIGRAHNSMQIKEAFAMARELGFDNINMDLIAGLPGENVESMRHTLQELRKLDPESITVHSLAIKRAANLNQQMSDFKNEINHETDEMLNLVSDITNELGMHPYYLYRQKNIGGNLENVGYSKPGKECYYNVLIMEELQSIVACGAGTVTKRVFPDGHIERCDNVKDVKLYIDKFDEMLERKRTLFAD